MAHLFCEKTPVRHPEGAVTHRQTKILNRKPMLLVDVGDRCSLCVVNDQPVGNPKRKV
jgi:hypothetical protein